MLEWRSFAQSIQDSNCAYEARFISEGIGTESMTEVFRGSLILFFPRERKSFFCMGVSGMVIDAVSVACQNRDLNTGFLKSMVIGCVIDRIRKHSEKSAGAH